MPKTRPSQPAAFKQHVIGSAIAGRAPAELAREFEVTAQSVTAWVARATADASKPHRNDDVLNSAERDILVMASV
jgi:transposase